MAPQRAARQAAQALAKALEERGAALRVLDISLNGAGDKGAAALAQALRANTSLRNLDLDRNRVGDAPPPPSYQSDTPRPSLRTNRTRRAPLAGRRRGRRGARGRAGAERGAGGARARAQPGGRRRDAHT